MVILTKFSSQAALEIVKMTVMKKISSKWKGNFDHWLHWKLSKWQFPVQPAMKISHNDDISVSVISDNTPFSVIHCPYIPPRTVVSRLYLLPNDLAKILLCRKCRVCSWRGFTSSKLSFMWTWSLCGHVLRRLRKLPWWRVIHTRETWESAWTISVRMMTSWHGNAVRVIGPL